MDGVTNGMMMTLLQIGTKEAMALLEKGGLYYDSQFESKEGVNDENGKMSDKEIMSSTSKGFKDSMKKVLTELAKC